MDPKLKMQQMLQEQAQLQNKWGYLIDDLCFEGYETEEEKAGMRNMVAQLLENQADAIALEEATTATGNIAQFKKYAFPLITRIYPILAVNHVCGVQPLTGPVGQIFTYEAKFASNKGDIAAGTSIWNNPTKNYTKELVSAETFQAAGASTVTYTGTLAWTPIRVSTVTVQIGTVTGADDGSGNIVGTGIDTGTINYTTGEIAITLDSADTAAGKAVYTYNAEGNTKIPEVEFEITSKPVQVADRPLRFKWTPQAMQDMYRQHGVIADKSFTKQATDLIQREISRDVVDTILAGATAGNENFSKTRPTYISYEDHKKQLVDTINIQSNTIYQKTYRGAGNLLICGKQALDIITTLPTFRLDSSAALKKPIGRIGVLNNQWVVVSDIDMAADKIVVGYKGTEFVEVGAVYSPYTFMYTDQLLLADDMQVRKGIISRDNFELINGDFYGTVTITS